MFNKDDFELPMEAELRLRFLKDEIAECDDIEALRNNLLEVTTLLVRYQSILNKMMKKIVNFEVAHMLEGIEE